MTEPVGDLSLCVERLAWLLASCPTFQALVNVNSMALALERIDRPYRDIERRGWPTAGAIITDDDALTQSNTWAGDAQGQLLVTFIGPVESNWRDHPENQLVVWRNRVGTILQEMFDRKGGDSSYGITLNVTQWTKVGTPTIFREEETGQQSLSYAAFLIEWVS
jgi:hypothetical protein